MSARNAPTSLFEIGKTSRNTTTYTTGLATQTTPSTRSVLLQLYPPPRLVTAHISFKRLFLYLPSSYLRHLGKSGQTIPGDCITSLEACKLSNARVPFYTMKKLHHSLTAGVRATMTVDSLAKFSLQMLRDASVEPPWTPFNSHHIIGDVLSRLRLEFPADSSSSLLYLKFVSIRIFQEFWKTFRAQICNQDMAQLVSVKINNEREITGMKISILQHEEDYMVEISKSLYRGLFTLVQTRLNHILAEMGMQGVRFFTFQLTDAAVNSKVATDLYLCLDLSYYSRHESDRADHVLNQGMIKTIGFPMPFW